MTMMMGGKVHRTRSKARRSAGGVPGAFLQGVDGTRIPLTPDDYRRAREFLLAEPERAVADDERITTGEAARILGVSQRTLTRMLDGGEWAMRFGISRHTAGNVGLVQIVPERPSGKLLPNLRDDVGIQQRSHVRGSQKTFQHFRVHGQQLRTAFGLRHVVLVHDRAHVSEQHVFRERRRRFRDGLAQRDDAGA